MNLRLLVAASFVVIASTVSSHAHGTGDKVTTSFDQPIPNIPGKSLIALVVDYPPGGESAPHHHAKSSFIYAYVVAGEIESRVNDGAARVYKAGESWSEPPGASHPVSRNVSKTEPARLLAVFVMDTGDKASDHACEMSLRHLGEDR